MMSVTLWASHYIHVKLCSAVWSSFPIADAADVVDDVAGAAVAAEISPDCSG